VLQVTGRTNYRDVGTALALPLEDEPERLELFEAAARSAAHFWRSRGLNALADFSGDGFAEDEDFVRITKRINGGTVGLADRRRYWVAAKRALGVA
jgi:putative chitinase